MASTKKTSAGRIECTCCSDPKKPDYYKSFNPIHKQTGKFSVCKNCMEKEYQNYLDKYKDEKLAIYYFCRKFDIYFSVACYDGALKNSEKTGWTILQSYFKQINSLRSNNSYGNCFDNSTDFLDRIVIEDDQIDSEKEIELTNFKNTENLSDEDNRNKDDVLNLLGYDPFENEKKTDKKYLYNKLIDYLDESTLEDSFKIPIVVEIVKSFNQIEKINQALANIDVANVSTKSIDIKNLMTTKTSMLNGILSMAKDNGISINHSNNKSKGAGTLSGIIKKLNELNLDDIEVNLFDIETSHGMRQVADISNRSILEQLNFDENDYTDMLKEQGVLINDMNDKLMKLEEENRKLKLNASIGGD